MGKKSPPRSEREIVKSLMEVTDDPESYNAMIDHWNKVFSSSLLQGKSEFSNLEAAALASINTTDECIPTSQVGPQVGHLLEKFDTPAYVVEGSGRIKAQNHAAFQTYGISDDGSLDDLPFELERGELLTNVIRASLNPQRNLQDAVLKRACSEDNETVTISIAPSKIENGGRGVALVFIIDARWKTSAAELFKREFDLSNAEQELLVGFLDGQTTQTMAKIRQRSHTTIRTQFHSLMGKMGARTQIELLRNALSVSQFVDQIDEISELIRHPHRKRVNIMRPGGRSVEVTIAGDFNGAPIIFLQNGVVYAFESSVEQAFLDSGFCVLSQCRPGYGDTDLPNKDEEYFETFAADLFALLDQLGHQTCMLMSSNISPTFMYFASKHVSSRVTGLIQVAGCGPISYFYEVGSSVPWAQGVISAAQKHPAFAEFMIRTGVRAWKALGQSKFMKSQFKNVPVELEFALRPEALKESQAALDAMTKQGFDMAAKDIRQTFSDFRSEVMATDIPILAIHGAVDPVFPIEAIRMFAKDFEPRMKLIELPDAGFSALSTHTDVIMKHVTNFYGQYDQKFCR